MYAQYGAVWMSYNSVMDPNAKSNTLGYHKVLWFFAEELRITMIHSCFSFHLQAGTTCLGWWWFFIFWGYGAGFDSFSFKDILLFIVYTESHRIKYPKEHKQAVEEYALANKCLWGQLLWKGLINKTHPVADWVVSGGHKNDNLPLKKGKKNPDSHFHNLRVQPHSIHHNCNVVNGTHSLSASFSGRIS